MQKIRTRGGFRAASQVLRLSVNTLRRHVEEFEREVGFTLFTRHVGGAMTGEVRPGVTEGLGTFQRAPRPVECQRAHPRFLVDTRDAGLEVLPTYAQALGGKSVPIDVGNIRFTNDIRFAYHPDAAKIARVRSLMDWLTEVFSPKKYPWFTDEFIHPRNLPAAAGGHPVLSLFGKLKEPEEV
jgi:hypothetical protein